MLEVHLDPATINSRKVLAGLELLGDAVQDQSRELFRRRPQAAALYSISIRTAMLPAAKDGDYHALGIRRDSAICGRHQRHRQILPQGLKKRVDINRWLLWEAAHWQPSCYVFFIENAIKPLMKAPTDQALLTG